MESTKERMDHQVLPKRYLDRWQISTPKARFRVSGYLGHVGQDTVSKPVQSTQIIVRILKAIVHDIFLSVWSGSQAKSPNSILSAPLPTPMRELVRRCRASFCHCLQASVFTDFHKPGNWDTQNLKCRLIHFILRLFVGMLWSLIGSFGFRLS